MALFIRIRHYVAFITALFLTQIFGAGPTQSASGPSDICNRAVTIIAGETGVPVDVLRAITLTETGRIRSGRTEPWPWTVNMEGKGLWFETEDDARSYVYEHFKRGARSFDVGCFQLNYKWHHQGFSSLDEMFDPLAGGRYAARFLRDLFNEKGDWTEAAGAYHSRTPKYAERYIAKFSQHLQTVSAAGDIIQAGEASKSVLGLNTSVEFGANPKNYLSRVNNFPLLQTNNEATGQFGSLVPLENTRSSKGLIDLDGTG